MTNFNERTNTLLYKNTPLTLYSRKGDVSLFVRGELETGTDYYILIQSSSDHSSTSSSSWLGLLNRGSLRAQALCLELVLTPLASYLQLTQAVCVLVIFLFDIHLLPLIYTGASPDWLLGRGSVCNMIYIYIYIYIYMLSLYYKEIKAIQIWTPYERLFVLPAFYYKRRNCLNKSIGTKKNFERKIQVNYNWNVKSIVLKSDYSMNLIKCLLSNVAESLLDTNNPQWTLFISLH